MGIFSSKIRTYVSSVVYNLAGDETLRSSYLQTTILTSVLAGSKTSLGTTLSSANLAGPGMRQKQFFLWARNNFGLGLPTATVVGSQDVDPDVLMSGLNALLSPAPGDSIKVITALIDDAEVDYWAEEWIRQNHPTLTEEDWSADFDRTTNQITISKPSGDTVIAADPDLVWGMERSLGRKILYVSYAIVTQDAQTLTTTEGDPIFLTYRLGSGNVALDSLQTTSQPLSEFFPALPLRLDNTSISDPSLETTYADVKKAFRKLTGKRVDDVLTSIEDNESIDDIDFAFLVQGVCLNSENNTAREYLYAFFQQLIAYQTFDKAALAAFDLAQTERKKSYITWNRWQQNTQAGNEAYPLAGTSAPNQVHKNSTTPGINELQIRSDSLPEFDLRLRWCYIHEFQSTGNCKTFDGDTSRGHASKGDYWFHVASPVTYRELVKRPNAEGQHSYVFLTRSFPRVVLFHQYAKHHYRGLDLVGLEHRNYVYKGHSVLTTAEDALSLEDEESGFLIPLHYPTLKAMGLPKQNQLSSSSSYLVFNSYTLVKQRWYQRGIFKVLLLIVSVVLTVVFPPAGGLMASTGILGSSVAIGTALGVANVTAAAIVGSVVNTIAAMLVTTMIQKASVEIFGDKVGTIIGTIVSFVALSFGQQFAIDGTFNVDWSNMMQAQNLTKISDAVTKAYSQWLNVDTQDIYSEMARMTDVYSEEMKRIEDLTNEVLGMTNALIDPIILTDATEHFEESSETFLSRTLLTGSDLAEITHGLIENFADISLELPRAIS